jgi:hypothetical protein
MFIPRIVHGKYQNTWYIPSVLSFPTIIVPSTMVIHGYPTSQLDPSDVQVGKTKKRKRRKRRRKTSVTRRGECENSPVLMV